MENMGIWESLRLMTPDLLADQIYTVLTPVSDLVTGGAAELEFVFGRHGNDTLYGYVPNDSTIQQFDYDVLIGDWFDATPVHIEILVAAAVDGNPLLILEKGPLSLGNDRFILGDWTQSFYTNNGTPDELLSTNLLGANEFALLFDFNPTEDIIQLHGVIDDYFLFELNNFDAPVDGLDGLKISGKAIFSLEQGLPDLVAFAFLRDEIDLDINADYFQFVLAPPNGPQFETILQFGTLGIDQPIGSAVDAFGNIYIAGGTSGSLNGVNEGYFDIFVNKYDPLGSLVWSSQIGGLFGELAGEITTDDLGNVYISGFTESDLFEEKQAEQNDGFVARLDSQTGEVIWGKHIFVDPAFANGSLDLDTDPSGNVYVSGVGVKANDEAGLEIFPFPTTDNAYITSFTSDGEQRWLSQVGTLTEIGSAFFDESYGVAADDYGNVYAVGWTAGILEFSDPSRWATNGTASYDIWVAKADAATGTIEWIDQFSSVDENLEFAWDIETDSQGNIYSYGWTLGNLGGENAGSYDIWLTKHLPDGTREWAKQFGTLGDDSAFLGGLTIDNNDNIYLVGQTDNQFDGYLNAGSYDVWVTKFNSDGQQQWLQQFGSPNIDYATDVSIGNEDYLIVTGFTEGSFGSENVGTVDAWVARLDSNSGDIIPFSTLLPTLRIGSEGNDTLFGTMEMDVLNGNEGDDILNGNEGDDILNGNEGNDILNGNEGNDILNGNEGNDHLNTDMGKDTLKGGDGDDIYELNANTNGGTQVEDTAGNDILIIYNLSLALQLPEEGIAGIHRENNDLIIDLNQDGTINLDEDLTLINFFADTLATTPEKGFIEDVDNLTGNEILDFFEMLTNEKPLLDINKSLTLDQGATATIDNTFLEVTDNDNNVEEITYTLTDLPNHGILTIDDTILFLNNTFTQADIDKNRLTYKHNGSETITDSFKFSVSDGVNGTIPDKTFNFDIRNLPTANDDQYSMNEGETLTIEANGVLDNDIDIDGVTLTSILVTSPSNGNLTFHENGSFSYTPDENFNGADRFTYQANDGELNSNTATVTITVDAINDLPILMPGTDSADILVGTNSSDFFVGKGGGDILTGNGGNDIFKYESLVDAGDIITDFSHGDKIDLSDIMASLGQSGSNALATGLVRVQASLMGTNINIFGAPFIILQNTSTEQMNNLDHFIF